MSDEFSLLNHKVDVMNEVVTDMKASLKELTSAITKLTLIEERQLNAAAALERAFKTIENIDHRVGQLQHLTSQTVIGILGMRLNRFG
jgi:hypothetical protein